MKKRLIKTIGLAGVIIALVLSFQAPSHAALSYQQTYVSSTGTNKVLVLVNSAIYSAIYDPSLKQYVADLEAEGYYVILTKFISGTPQDVKNYFKSLSGLKGVVLVGDLPVARYEIAQDYNGYAEFPCDVFYMELVGQWSDNNANGLYDTYKEGIGTNDSEIWVTRLTASTVTRADMDEVAMLKNYFYKNHNYRLGKLTSNKNALEYLDDDFRFMETGLAEAYPGRLKINDPNTTTADDYKTRLTQNYEWLHMIAHSTPLGHWFYNSVGSNVIFYSYEIPAIEPKILFYSVGGCSSCRFTDYNYMGGHYIFSKQSGLIALGSTKVGHTFLTSFYPEVRKKTIGEAFKYGSFEETNDWMKDPSIPKSVYFSGSLGTTVLGDGTLRLDPPIPIICSITPSTIERGRAVLLSGSGSVANGTLVSCAWRSSINGYLGSLPSTSTKALSTGTHTIYFKVKDDKGRWSSEAKATLVVGPLAAPSNLTATPVSKTQVALSWKDNSSAETGFKVYASLDNINIALVATLGANVKSYTVGSLTAGKKYYFQVRAYNSATSSAYSNTATATTLP